LPFGTRTAEFFESAAICWQCGKGSLWLFLAASRQVAAAAFCARGGSIPGARLERADWKLRSWGSGRARSDRHCVLSHPCHIGRAGF